MSDTDSPRNPDPAGAPEPEPTKPPEAWDAEERTAYYVEQFLARLEREASVDLDLFCAEVPEKIRAAVRERCIDIQFIKRVFKARQASDPSPLPRSDISTGRELGDFRMLRELGHGANGVVYLARQMSLNRLVAVKVLHPHLSLSPRHIERFRREALSAAKLQHPSIVPIYSVGQAEGMHFFAMEFVPGRSLALELEALRARRRESRAPSAGERLDVTPGRTVAAEAAEICAQLAEALHYAHQRGIIHRDVKPQNVLLSDGLAPHLVDFGLAKDLEELSLSRSGEIAGTPYYMSPEQALAKRVKIDHRTDVYSLGVVLYEVLTLRRPFEGKTSNEVLFEITFTEPPPIRTLNKRVPRDLETIVNKAMEKSPERRYPSAGEMAADLRRFLGHESILARPPSFLEVGRRRLARHRVIAIATAAAVVALLLGVWLADKMITRRELAGQLDVVRELAKVPDLGAVDPDDLAQRAGVVRGVVSKLGALDEDDRALVEEVRAKIEKVATVRKKRGLELRARSFGESSALPTNFADHRLAPSSFDYWWLIEGMASLREAAALGLEDEELERVLDLKANLPRLSVTTDAVGDLVSLRALPAIGTELGPKQELGRTPLREVPVAPGFYRIVVERETFGFAELTRYLDVPGKLYEVEARIRDTHEIARDMALIPAGESVFGSCNLLAQTGERRMRLERLNAYRIDTLEVSNGEYRRFVADTKWRQPLLWRERYESDWDKLPVAGVRWIDAVAYAEWAGKRLATIYEWSRAARGPDSWLYPWSPSGGELATRAVIDRPSFDPQQDGEYLRSYLGGVQPVASLPAGASPDGLLHTFDNVAEWTETMASFSPDGELALVLQPGFHLICGGSWLTRTDEGLTLADERRSNMYYELAYTGIRCAKSVEP